METIIINGKQETIKSRDLVEIATELSQYTPLRAITPIILEYNRHIIDGLKPHEAIGELYKKYLPNTAENGKQQA